jgi:hypothetical protein
VDAVNVGVHDVVCAREDDDGVVSLEFLPRPALIGLT